MWRMNYTIIANLPRFPKVLETMHRMADCPEKYTEQEAYDYVRYVIGLMQKTGWIKTEGFGFENLPKDGGYVLYPNHQGKYDAYSIASVHEKPLTVVMDKEMSYFPLVDEIIRVLKGKRLDINSSRHAMETINEIAREVAEGRRPIIFPEGAYSNDKKNSLWDFKPGCFKAALRAKAPIVPVALIDSFKAFNSWTFAPVKTQVHFLKPLYPEDYEGMSTSQIAAIVKERIQAKLAELGHR